MGVYLILTEILKIQRFRQAVGYTGFFCFTALLSYAYNNNTWAQFNMLPNFPFWVAKLVVILFNCAYFSSLCRTRAGYSRADQFYAAYPAGTELLTDTAKVIIDISVFLVLDIC